ncbi:hypothetical protein [Maribacter sp.]|uniref:FEKKY domain-containing protein n=1 Tax=Maribacter sp. TaxID=1897614 RepID=UPI003299101B
MKFKLLLIITIFFSNISVSQVEDTIHGRVISSVTKSAPEGAIYIIEKSSSNGTMADSTGFFKLVPSKKRETYDLEISAGFYGTLNYKYLSEWTKRSKPKSIIISVTCNLDSVMQDWRKTEIKLYIIGSIAPVANSKSDNRFEKKYKLKYFDFGCEPSEVYECIEKYNRRAFMFLDLKYKDKWRKKVRKDVIGLN